MCLQCTRWVFGGYFIHFLAMYLQCTCWVHRPLPPVPIQHFLLARPLDIGVVTLPITTLPSLLSLKSPHHSSDSRSRLLQSDPTWHIMCQLDRVDSAPCFHLLLFPFLDVELPMVATPSLPVSLTSLIFPCILPIPLFSLCLAEPHPLFPFLPYQSSYQCSSLVAALEILCLRYTMKTSFPPFTPLSLSVIPPVLVSLSLLSSSLFWRLRHCRV